MQFGSELVLFSSFATIVISVIVSTYLLRLWFRQKNRLMTDLPLVFAISMVSNAFNMVMIVLPIIWSFTPSMEYFRFRTLIIGASVIPMLGALLQIWLPSKKKYHNRFVYLFALYWGLVTFLGATQEIIMAMCIPLILVSGVVIMATFIITWKTGRLKEIRSEFMVVSMVFTMASQVLRVQLVSTPFFYIPDLLFMISFIIIGLGFATSWKDEVKDEKPDSSMQQHADLTVPS